MAFVVGPFEEEEMGIDIPSDVVKVKGEDPATPVFLRGTSEEVRRRSLSWVRAPWPIF